MWRPAYTVYKTAPGVNGLDCSWGTIQSFHPGSVKSKGLSEPVGSLGDLHTPFEDIVRRNAPAVAGGVGVVTRRERSAA